MTFSNIPTSIYIKKKIIFIQKMTRRYKKNHLVYNYTNKNQL